MTLRRIIVVLVFALLLGAIWGFGIEPSLLVQNEQDFVWRGPKIKVAFFSDLHAGAPHISKKHIKEIVQKINAQNPDLVLIGGDLVINGIIGGKVMPIEEVAQYLKELSAPLGKFVTLGNHDWWSNGEKIRKVLEENGFQVLENEAIFLKHKDKTFWLVGLGDDFTHHAEPEKAFAKVYGDTPKLLFMHDPAAIFKVQNRYDLALAGHMHGGQVFVPGYGALVSPGAAPKSWSQGWIDFPMGKIFVSRGIGTSILPVRINAIPEYVILDLH